MIVSSTSSRSSPITHFNQRLRSRGGRHLRQWITSAGPEVYTNDSAKLARAILDTTRDPQPPLRLTLGGDAYEMIHTALRAQIEARYVPG